MNVTKSYNNTNTLSNSYFLSSISQNEENIIIKNSNDKEVSNFENILSFEYLSIELNRIKIKADLIELFDFETKTDELDFLAANSNLRLILPIIGKYIRDNLDVNSKLELELMNENKDWQTLFINIPTCVEWEISNRFIDKFLDNLYKLYPELASKLNLNIIPNEL